MLATGKAGIFAKPVLSLLKGNLWGTRQHPRAAAAQCGPHRSYSR